MPNAWRPKPEEPVLCWFNGWEYCLVQMFKFAKDPFYGPPYDHIARWPDFRLESLEKDFVASLNLEEWRAS